MLEPATTIARERKEPLYNNHWDLYPYERNIKTILDLANVRGTRVVLTTQPHSTDPEIPIYWAHDAIDDGNDIMRRIRQEYLQQALFVDLDSMMTGTQNALFKDLGHLHPEGIRMKAEAIGAAIAEDVLNPVLNDSLPMP